MVRSGHAHFKRERLAKSEIITPAVAGPANVSANLLPGALQLVYYWQALLAERRNSLYANLEAFAGFYGIQFVSEPTEHRGCP